VSVVAVASGVVRLYTGLARAHISWPREVAMSEEKPKPLDDVKEGLGLLLRAAKTAAKGIPTDNVENIVVEGAKEVGRAFETVASTIDDMWNKATGSSPPPPDAPASADAPPASADPATASADDAPAAAPATAPAAPPAPTPADASPTAGDKATDASVPAGEPRGPRVG
jgi:hypothetical protein